jgi:hypothetical protein
MIVTEVLQQKLRFIRKDLLKGDLIVMSEETIE